MMIISFKQCSFNLFILFATPMFSSIAFVTRFLLFESKAIQQHPLYLTLFMFVGQLLSLILDSVVVLKSSRRNFSNKQLTSAVLSRATKFSLVKNTNIPQAKLCSFTNLLLLAFCAFYDLVSTAGIFFSSAYSSSLYNEYQTKVFLILSSIGLSSLFFKYPIYRHQLVAMAFIIIGEVVFYVFDAPYQLTDLLYFIWYTLQAFGYINSKWLMEEKYVTPFRVVGFRGLFGLFMTLMAIWIADHISCHWVYCAGSTVESLGYFLTIFRDMGLALSYSAFALIFFFLNVGYEMVTKVFDPNHTAMSGMFSSVLQMLIASLLKPSQFRWMHLIANVLVLVGCLMHNELIIFHFLGLDYNTRKLIELRSKEELSSANHAIDLTNSVSVSSGKSSKLSLKVV